jgi:hypothetical protein
VTDPEPETTSTHIKKKERKKENMSDDQKSTSSFFKGSPNDDDDDNYEDDGKQEEFPTYELSLEKPWENPWNTFAIFTEGQVDATKKVKFDFITGMIAKLDPRDRQPTIVPVDRYTIIVTEQVSVIIQGGDPPPMLQVPRSTHICFLVVLI